MEAIIPKIERKLIEQELTKDKLLRKTNVGGNELYIVTHHDSPNTMKEIARLREVTFRYAGGGTGKSSDIDQYDTMENPYKQLIVWDPEIHEILGGYRFHACKTNKGIDFNLATSQLFSFSEEFKTDFLPYMIELGRSFVQPEFQATGDRRKALYALDNLWDGLGALTILYPDIKYFFGKVTMYTHFDKTARNLILYFLNKYFNDDKGLMQSEEAIFKMENFPELNELFNGGDYKNDYKILRKEVTQLGEAIPPLINAYMNLTPTMKVFGTVENPYFGKVEETAILININDIHPQKKERYIDSFANFLKKYKISKLQIRKIIQK